MNFNHYTALLALLILGNSLCAMESETESSEEETAQAESFWSAQLSGVDSLLAFGRNAVSSFYETVKTRLEAIDYDDILKEVMSGYIKQPSDINNLWEDEFPFWLKVRMRIRGNPSRFPKTRRMILGYEAALREANMLTPFDDLLRAILDKNTEEVKRLSAQVVDINSADSNGFTVLRVATIAENSYIPLLCEHPHLDPNASFSYIPHPPERRVIPTCALLKILLTNNVTQNFGQKPCEVEVLHAVSCLAEKGATISPELFKYLTLTGDISRYTRTHFNYPLLMALGTSQYICVKQWGWEAQPLDTYTRSEENLLCCYYWALAAENKKTVAPDSEHPILLNMRKHAEQVPTFIPRVKRAEQFFETDRLKRSFKECLMAELRCDWLLEPQDVNGQDALGMTPMMWAAARGNLELAQFLIQFPALDLMKLDKFFGFSALHFAIRNGHTGMVRLLIELPGAHRIQNTRSGRSPYQLAQRCKQNNVIAFLDDRNKRRLHLLKCLLLKTLFPSDIRKLIVKEL